MLSTRQNYMKIIILVFPLHRKITSLYNQILKIIILVFPLHRKITSLYNEIQYSLPLIYKKAILKILSIMGQKWMELCCSQIKNSNISLPF